MKKIINKKLLLVISSIIFATPAVSLISCSITNEQQYEQQLQKINQSINLKDNKHLFNLRNNDLKFWEEWLQKRGNNLILKDQLKEGYSLKIEQINLNNLPSSISLILVLNSPHQEIISKKIEVKIVNLESPAKKEHVYFWFKPDNQEDIKNWGVHVWGQGYKGEAIFWDSPIIFNDKDDRGNIINEAGFYRATIKNVDVSQDLNYIIHKGDFKNNPDAILAKNQGNEFWFVQGSVKPYNTRPKYLITQFTRSSKDEIILKLESNENEQDFNSSLLKLYDAFSNELYVQSKYSLDYSKTNENGKHFHIFKIKLKDENITLGDKFFVKIGADNNLIDSDTHTYSRAIFKEEDIEYDEDQNLWLPDLGANLANDFKSVNFKLWAPISKSVHIVLYDKNDQNKAIGQPIELKRGKGRKQNIFEVNLDKSNTNLDNFDAYFYELILDKGTKFEKIVLDPYAKSMASFNPDTNHPGKGAFVNMNSPKAGILSEAKGIYSGQLEGQLNKMIASEIHVRDYTISQDIPNAGTFKGFSNWDKGIEHLKQMGYTHVQFLPLQNYWTVNESEQTFAKGEGVFEQENIKITKEPNYNWGYDPHNYFSIEGWLSSNPNDPYSRISELRALIKKLHDNNIGVIVDVVYNHMFNNKILEDIVPNYYFRAPGGTQPVGAPALASENKMARKIIVESAKWLVDQYGVDGFRFDLMGFIDKETLEIIKKEVKTKDGHEIILYGEAWDFSDLPKEKRLIKGQVSSNSGVIKNIGYFNDSIRDGIKGGAGDGQALEQGFIHGNYEDAPRVKASIIGNIKNFAQSSEFSDQNFADISPSPSYSRFADEPNEAIQYLAIHDGFTLWDKINLSTKAPSNLSKEQELEYKINLMKQAFGILLTSQGRIVIQGGDETGRSKPLSLGDANPQRANTSSNALPLDLFKDISGVINNRFHENSYKASDFANSFKWDRIKEGFANSQFIKLKNYVKDLIKIRKENYEFRFESAQEINDNVRFFGEEKLQSKFGPYKTLSDLNGEFKINFINAPQKYRNQRWYLAGEVAKDGANNEIDAFVDIDNEGKGSVIIKDQAFKNLEKNINSSWGNAINEFNFKLVKEPGSWETIESAYSGFGNTKLTISSLSSSKSVTINLLITNQKVYPENYKLHENMIQFHIKAPNNVKYSEFIVAINPKDTLQKVGIKLDDLSKNNWIVLADNEGSPILEKRADGNIAPHSVLILANKR